MDAQDNYSFLQHIWFLTSHGNGSHNTVDFLRLFLYMVLCSGLYYMEARAFLRIVSHFGQRSRKPLAPDSARFYLVWLLIGVMTLGPLLFAFTLRYPIDPVWALLIVLLFGLSLIPAGRHIRRNMSTLYKSGYLKRS